MPVRSPVNALQREAPAVYPRRVQWLVASCLGTCRVHQTLATPHAVRGAWWTDKQTFLRVTHRVPFGGLMRDQSPCH
ncbi:MAG: hypothetical protein E7K97_22360 [Providencia rettgeri]|nr:hypothetical protein [Providencia rettgeri]